MQHFKIIGISVAIISVLSFNGFVQAATFSNTKPPVTGTLAHPITATTTVAITPSTTLYIETDSAAFHTCYIAITKNATSSESSSISCVAGIAAN